jgi:hypothetical protein
MTYAGFQAATNFAAELFLGDDQAPTEKTDTVINPMAEPSWRCQHNRRISRC